MGKGGDARDNFIFCNRVFLGFTKEQADLLKYWGNKIKFRRVDRAGWGAINC